MDIKQLFKSKNRLSVYNKLSIEEEINIRQAVERISWLKREALSAARSAAEVEGWSIDRRLHDQIAFLHRFQIEVNDIPLSNHLPGEGSW